MVYKLHTGSILNCIFYGGLWLSLWILFFYFGHVTGTAHISLFFKIFSACADSSLFVFFLIFLRGKWKYCSLVIPFLISFILWVNTLYFRNFQDLIPASLYLTNQAGDETVVSSISNSSRASDIILLLAPFIPVIITFGLNRRCFVQTKPQKLLIIGAFVVLSVSWGITFGGAYRRVSIYHATSERTKVLKGLYPEFATNWIFFYDQHNFTGYLFRCIYKSIGTKKILTQRELIDIKEYLSSKNMDKTTDNSFSKRNNLVFIVVESMPRKILELEDRKKYIPVLDSLLNEPMTILSRTLVIPSYGRSSDAQFIYNTGLLPLRDEPVVTNHASKDYPSISKAIGGYSMEIIGEKGSLWSHNVTNKSYGYDNLISDIAAKEINQDSIIFNRATQELNNLTQPFFLFISTLSMHDPCLISKVSPRLSPMDLENFKDERDKEYLQRLSHFDYSLGTFLQNLKEQGKYDETVIVIIGDHEIREECISEKFYDNSVPLILLNSGKSGFYKREITQLDIFPSILDILNLNYRFLNVPYSGLGQSIFRYTEDTNESTPSEEDYKVSEMLIRGTY